MTGIMVGMSKKDGIETSIEINWPFFSLTFRGYQPGLEGLVKAARSVREKAEGSLPLLPGRFVGFGLVNEMEAGVTMPQSHITGRDARKEPSSGCCRYITDRDSL